MFTSGIDQLKTEKSIPNSRITVFHYYEELKENIKADQMKIAIEITRNFGELSNRLNILRIYNENKQ